MLFHKTIHCRSTKNVVEFNSCVNTNVHSVEGDHVINLFVTKIFFSANMIYERFNDFRFNSVFFVLRNVRRFFVDELIGANFFFERHVIHSFFSAKSFR